MKVAISGASGLVGTALAESLAGSGHQVLKLVRRVPIRADEVRWWPLAGELDLARLAGVDAIVHLAGESINSGRWTANVKRRIVESRVQGTRTIATAVSQLRPPPQVVVSASAVGYYGDRGDEVLTEASPPGTGFMAETVQAWEGELDRLRAGPTRVVTTRFGVVLARHGGALPLMLLPFRLGVGGRIGNGRQWLAWVSLVDAVRAVRFVIETPGIRGPVNVTGEPVRNAEFTQAAAAALRRPALFIAPGFALKLVLGEMAEELLLASQRVESPALRAHGFKLAHPDIRTALAAILRGRDRGAPAPAA